MLFPVQIYISASEQLLAQTRYIFKEAYFLPSGHLISIIRYWNMKHNTTRECQVKSMIHLLCIKHIYFGYIIEHTRKLRARNSQSASFISASMSTMTRNWERERERLSKLGFFRIDFGSLCEFGEIRDFFFLVLFFLFCWEEIQKKGNSSSERNF